MLRTRASARVVAIVMAMTLLTSPLAAAEPGPEGPSGGAFTSLPYVQTPFYIKTASGDVVIHGDLSPGPPGPEDNTAEVYVDGPTFPRTTLTRIGVFEFYVDWREDGIPLRITSIEHVSIWAKANEDVTDAEFRVIMKRNEVEIADMRTVPTDLGTTPTEQVVADIPPLSVEYIPGDLMELEVQYTAASRVGTGPAPDCIFLANSVEFPSRIEFMAAPMEIEVEDPEDLGEMVWVEATVRDTSGLDPLEDLDMTLGIICPKVGTIDAGTITLNSREYVDAVTHVSWYWHYNRTYTPADMYTFTVVVSYGVPGVQYTASITKWFDLPTDPAFLDTDGDGHMDVDDAFPNNASEWADTDGDGYGDNCDRFPDNASEWYDRDGDGYGDNCDEFPRNATEWVDTDGDGVGDNSDVFPFDVTEWRDADGDGVGDNSDAFPDDTWEWVDTDGDGVGDNSDTFPDDVNEWRDTDADGVGDNGDRFPIDPAASMDTDGDGHPDEWHAGYDEDRSTTGLTLDRYPYDQNRWEEEAGPDGVGLSTLMVSVIIVVIMLIIVLVYVILFKKNDIDSKSK